MGNHRVGVHGPYRIAAARILPAVSVRTGGVARRVIRPSALIRETVVLGTPVRADTALRRMAPRTATTRAVTLKHAAVE